MIDAIIKGITDIANARIRKDFPCLGHHHFNEHDVKYMQEAAEDLSKKMEVWMYNKGAKFSCLKFIR